MKNLKTFEGFFDFFKKSEDEKILEIYIKRLERVKSISPYDITLDTSGTEENEKYHFRYTVEFEDTPLKVVKAICDRRYSGWSDETQKSWIKNGAIKMNNYIFYSVTVNAMCEPIDLKVSASKAEKIFNLIEKVYLMDKDARRIKKIKDEINPAADHLDPDIYKDINNMK